MAEPQNPQPPQVAVRCPHSHLSIEFLKKIGRTVEKVGEGAVETALTVALSNLGAFQD